MAEEEKRKIKREELIKTISIKRDCERKAQDIVYNLLEKNVKKEFLLESAKHIYPSHLEDVFEERQLIKLCGWPLCDNELGKIPKQTYVIRANKVLDIADRKKFCSSICYTIAMNFLKQLISIPLWMRDEEDEDLPEFNILEDPEKELQGKMVKLSILDDIDLDNNLEKEEDVDVEDEEKENSEEEEDN